MELTGQLTSLAVLLLLSGFFSSSETALTSLGPHRTRALLREDPRRYRHLRYWLDHPDRTLITILIGNNVVNIAASSVATMTSLSLLQQAGASDSANLAVALTTGVMTLLLLTFGEITPKTYARRNAIRMSTLAMGPLTWMVRVLAPLVVAMMVLTGAITRALGAGKSREGRTITEDFLRSVLRQGERDGALESDEYRMMTSIFEFGETTAGEAMVPRTRMTMLPADADPPACLDTAMRSGHSRIPVYDRTVENVIGILHVKDLLRLQLDRRAPFELRKVVRPAHFVPELSSLDKVLSMFQRERIHLALVVDEYGGLEGLLTLEDVLEEIVGEIRDEHDTAEEAQLEEVIPGSEFLAPGSLEIRQLNRRLHTELPHDNADTLAGLLADLLGHIPSTGDHVRVDGLRLEVLQASSRRAERVRLVRVDTPEEAATQVSTADAPAQ